MKRYLMLVFVLCLVVGCGTEPMPTAAPPTEASIGDTWIRPTDGMVMVFVPAGEFLMGSTDEDIDSLMAELGLTVGSYEREELYAHEQPQHTVYLDAFWIDQTEVTNAQYRQCVEDGDCDEAACWDEAELNAPNQPVVCLSWDDAQAYAAWAGGRLPTEAEWEKAASWDPETGKKRVYPWGNRFEPSRLNLCDENCFPGPFEFNVDDGYARTAPVGSYPGGASPCGALDMAGNAFEYVADWADAEYYASSPARNPQGPGSGEYRVIRGGSWGNMHYFCRCAFRYFWDPGLWADAIGFRLVASPGPSGP